MRSLLVFMLLLSSSAKADLIDETARFLSGDELKGRSAGRKGNIIAREWLEKKLGELGVFPAGTERYQQPFDRGTNLLGIIYPGGLKTNAQPTVILGAHFDHTTHCDKNPNARSKVCNGAADNAAAVAAVLGAAQGLSEKIKSPVAIALWDAEEKGLLGSRAFVKNPTFPLKDVQLYINLDIIGLNLFRGLENHSFIMGAETGGEKLIEDVSSSAQNQPVTFHQISYGFGHGRSDMSSFIRAGKKIPVLFFSDGDGHVYHTSADEYEFLNMIKVRSISSVIAQLAVKAAEEKKYVFNAPSIVPLLDVVMPKYSDVPTLLEVIKEVRLHEKENLLGNKGAQAIAGKESSLELLQQQGPENFSTLDAVKLGLMVQSLTKASRQLDFVP